MLLLNGEHSTETETETATASITHILVYVCTVKIMVHGPWSTFGTEISDRCECIKFGCFREWWGWRWWKMELLGSDTEWECELHSHWNEIVSIVASSVIERLGGI